MELKFRRVRMRRMDENMEPTVRMLSRDTSSSWCLVFVLVRMVTHGLLSTAKFDPRGGAF